MSSKFEELLISKKREQFLNAVIRACQEIGAIPSYVNFDGCNFSRDENAHIHLEQNIICVSENYLKRATYEDLKSTAYHEVAHLINGTHDCGFTKLCNSLKTTLWRPPLEVQRKHLDDFEREQIYNYMEEDLRKWKRIEIDENGEEYFLKGKTLFKRYLKDEIPSYKPRCILTKLPKRVVSDLPRSAPEINTYEEKREETLQKIESIRSQKRLLIEEINDCVDRGLLGKRKEILDKITELDRPSIEKCVDLRIEELKQPFDDETIFKRLEKKKNKRMKKLLLKENKNRPHGVDEIEEQDTNQADTERKTDNILNNPPMQVTPIKSLNWFAVIILLIIISSSLYFVIGYSNSQNTNHVTPSNFSNNNAEKVTNPLPTPKDSFDKINEYREQNKKYRILWSDNAYRLADFRAADMVKRNYFSHTTPDGKTVSDYIGKYNFYSDSTWGENLCKGCSDPIQTWIGSADDREVLLDGWGKGAVACESDICVFIGVNE